MFVCLFIHSFICLWMSNCFSIICWKGYLSFVALLLHPHQNHICVDLFLDSLFSSSFLYVIIRLLPNYMDCCKLMLTLEIRYCKYSYFVLHFQNYFNYSVHLDIHIHFRISLYISTKKKTLGFLFRLNWTCRWICEELPY